MNWPFATLWLTDEPSQSARAHKHASFDSKQKHATVLFCEHNSEASAFGLCRSNSEFKLTWCCLLRLSKTSGQSYLSASERSSVWSSSWYRTEACSHPANQAGLRPRDQLHGVQEAKRMFLYRNDFILTSLSLTSDISLHAILISVFPFVRFVRHDKQSL